MIKKPESPNLADYVRGNEEIINQKWQAVANYRKKLFDAVAEEFATTSAEELVILLTEKYHPDLRQNQKQGRKKKWTPKIEVMLAVFIQLRLEEGGASSIDDDIMKILTWEPWKQFAEKGNKQEVLSLDTFRKHQDAGKKSDLFQFEMDAYRKDPVAWMAELVKNLTN